MAKRTVPEGSEVIAALSPADPAHSMRHAPKAVSPGPIFVGGVIFLISAWWVVAAVNNPYVDPDAAPGEEVASSESGTEVTAPSGLDGKIVVFVDEPVSHDDVFTLIVDGDPLATALPADGTTPPTEPLNTPERFTSVAAFVAAEDAEYAVSVPAGWAGRVSFVDAEDPPERPDWRTITLGIVMGLASGTLAAVWIVRRHRAKKELQGRIAQLRAQGYDVD